MQAAERRMAVLQMGQWQDSCGWPNGDPPVSIKGKITRRSPLSLPWVTARWSPNYHVVTHGWSTGDLLVTARTPHMEYKNRSLWEEITTEAESLWTLLCNITLYYCLLENNSMIVPLLALFRLLQRPVFFLTSMVYVPSDMKFHWNL